MNLITPPFAIRTLCGLFYCVRARPAGPLTTILVAMIIQPTYGRPRLKLKECRRKFSDFVFSELLSELETVFHQMNINYQRVNLITICV